MAAVAAEFVRAVELRQLDPASRQLKKASILIEHLTQRSHLMPAILADQPHRIALPFSDSQRGLPRKIKIYRFAIG